MSEVNRARRIRRNAATWRGLFVRQARSGLSVSEFCRTERINATLFHRWRARLGSRSMPAIKGAPGSEPAPFIDLGAIREERSQFDIRLELGSGVVLSIARH